jgi:hypothetical protein
VPSSQENNKVSIIFEGPNKEEFNNKKDKTQPLIFHVPEDKMKLFPQIP